MQDKNSFSATDHSRHSSYREMLLEHLFVGEVMRHVWVSGGKRLEILKPQVDDAGYDLVFEMDQIVRHIQLKTSFEGSTVRRFNVNAGLVAQTERLCHLYPVRQEESRSWSVPLVRRGSGPAIARSRRLFHRQAYEGQRKGIEDTEAEPQSGAILGFRTGTKHSAACRETFRRVKRCGKEPINVRWKDQQARSDIW